MAATEGMAFVPLAKTHDRRSFSCGNETLDRYLRETAMQDQKRGVAFAYALAEGTRIAAYYTLASAEVSLEAIRDLGLKLPRYPSVPCVRIGRLAVSLDYRGRGVGGLAVQDAALRTRRSGIGTVALLVEAKPDAVGFYEALGFHMLEGSVMAAPLSAFVETGS